MPSTWHNGPNGERSEVGTFVHEGREFTAGGAYVSDTHAIGYPTVEAGAGELRAWDGSVLGTCRVTGTSWAPGRYGGSRLYAYRATINGRDYYGRGSGKGCILKLRACKAKRTKKGGN